MLSNFVNPLFLNAVNFITGRDNVPINPIFGITRLESDPKHTKYAGFPLMVFELIAVTN